MTRQVTQGRITFCILAFWLASGSVLADPAFSAAQLQTMCGAKQDKESDTFCSIYIAGVYDGFAGAQLMRQQNVTSCMPAIGPGNARIIIEKYLDDHPEMLSKPAMVAATLALMSAFRCDRKK